MKKYLLSTLMLFASSPLLAENFKLVPTESEVAWVGTKKIGSSHQGHILVKEGKIETDKKGEIKKGTVVIDMVTLSNSDLKDSPEDQKKLVGHLSSPDFFNVAKYPKATFKLKSAKKQAENNYLITGDLTMIGKTNKIEFPATINISNGVLNGNAKVKINRTKWGLKYNSGNFFKDLAADRIINDEFELNIKLTAKK